MLTPKNILVVRADRMGDVVLTVPSIRALKRAFPQAKVSVWLDASTKPLLDGLPFVDEILVEDKRRAWWGYFRFVLLLRRRKFDLAVVYNTKRRTNMACFLAGIPQRLGYKNEKYGWLLTHPVEDRRHLGEKHETEYCLDLLREIGVGSKDLALEVACDKDAEVWADAFAAEALQGKPFAAIHASASCSTRFWPVGSYVELIGRLAGAGMGIVLVGGKDAQGAAKEITDSVQTSVLDMTGKTSLPQLVSLLRRVRVLVSNDSGPVHVAAAAGTPVVSIFLRSQPGINPERWRPLGPKSRVVLPRKGEEVVVDRHSHVISGSFDNILPEQVFKVIEEVI